MPYITRDDGEHFVIPSYRDVLAAKNKTQLKSDILLLSQSYGEYITLQRKNAAQYEIAFSPDTGYLLGESIWHHFKRPLDMIYCEAIPNTTEAILVIVKAGSVYLDGRFPLESISEELIIFLTQQNNFEIYIYGDVPIAQTPTAGKFSFETSAVKTFTVLDNPVFATLPLLKIYQLQLVDPVLKAHGIGVFPIKQILLLVIALGLGWMLYSYITAPQIEEFVVSKEDPYQAYYNTLLAPAPDQEIQQFLAKFEQLYTMPGWTVKHVDYTRGNLIAKVESGGSKTQTLMDWAGRNQATVDIRTDGMYVSMPVPLINRPQDRTVYVFKEVMAKFIDNLSQVYPGNRIKLDTLEKKINFTSVKLVVNVENVSPFVLVLISKQFKDLPIVILNLALDVDNGSLTGSIVTQVLGS